VHRLPPRLVGVILIAASGASTLVHRSVYQAANQGPAQTAEFALGLLTFMLASAGILLLVHGGKLLERGNASSLTPERQPADIAARLMEPTKIHGRIYDTRRGASLMQARHAIRTSRRLVSRNTPHGKLLLGTRRSILSIRR
jgi:hypothetical protein